MKNYLKVLSLFFTIGISTLSLITIAYTSIIFKNNTNSSRKNGSKDFETKILNTKNYSYKRNLVSEEQFLKKIDAWRKFLEQSFKNTSKANSWKIFRKTQIIEKPQSLTKNNVELKNEFKSGNLKIRALLYIQNTPETWSKEQNQNYYSSQTKKWSEQISKKLTNLLKIEQSSFSPFVNFIFKDFNDKEKNLDILQNEKRIKAVFSYENLEIKNAKPSSELAIQKVNKQNKQNHLGVIPKKLEKEKKSVFESIFKEAKLNTQIDYDRNNFDSLKRIKIGILESGWSSDRSAAYVDGDLDTFDRTIIRKKLPKGKTTKHASLVAAIAAGENGINIKATIYSANVKYGIQSAVEWMIKNKVKVINHSYYTGSGVFYDDNTYYIDFIARKYPVTNVYCAGNYGKKISGNQLSINSIVVGGLNSTNSWKANSSNFGIFNGGNDFLNQLPKPLIIAKYSGFNDSIAGGSGSNRRGTSYSAPIITGALSLILRDFKFVGGRAEGMMAILAASATKLYDPSHNEEIWEGSGFNKNVGAGKLNFINMKKAAKNMRSFTIARNKNNNPIPLNSMFLNRGEKLSASMAWLYNGGYQNYNFKDLSSILAFEKWKLKNNSETWKRKKYAFSDLKESRLFNDYNITLKLYDKNTCTWSDVTYSKSIYSNVELFRYKVMESGIYKLEISKHSGNSISYENAPNDVLAVSYVKE